MHVVTKETIKAMGRRFAAVALDQGDEFGSCALTLQAYRENLIDTLADEGLDSWTWLALDAYDNAIAA